MLASMQSAGQHHLMYGHLSVQVWVITGDKQETAINIAISCKLIRHPDSLLICNADSPEGAARRIAELTDQVRLHTLQLHTHFQRHDASSHQSRK